MTLLKIKIAARLKVKAAGVNLSRKRIDAIVLRAEKGLTDESDDAAIDTNLDIINELTSFKEIAALDDYQRAKDKKISGGKDAEGFKTIGVSGIPADTPEWMKIFIAAQTASNKALQDQIAELYGDKVTGTRRESFIKPAEGASKEYPANEFKRFDRMSFKDDADFSSFLDDIKDAIMLLLFRKL